ncbi:609_t:CDS:2 [Ambispora gerdemannii]|uniref:609_t:CDS:1 n=1 Tax=Ambispora gerdemannii TaxID=144530 RepID=A0A9N9BYY6_9GLOM|nr:609_t:CDS:2 [Ambispora gerdemannii]
MNVPYQKKLLIEREIARPFIIKASNNNKNKQIPNLPSELIRDIFFHLKDDKKTLSACTLVNHTFNLHATPILYQTVTFTFPNTFVLFANAISGESYRTSLIKHLDLSSFSTFGLQKSHSETETQKSVTPQALINILKSTPMLEAFSVSESLESAITIDVLRTLVSECRNLKSLDFCGCSSKQFNDAMKDLVKSLGLVQIVQFQTSADSDIEYGFQRLQPLLPHIKRLSLHECLTLSEHETILPLLAHMPNITHLDLGGCSISDLTLEFLETETNTSNTLLQLSLAKCKNITSDGISRFVSQCNRLENLNLYGDTMISEWDLVTILSSPSAESLRSLDIGFSHITQRVLNAIKKHCSSSLQNLGLANAEITTPANLSTFLISMPQLQYIDLSNIPCLNPLNTNGLMFKLQKDSNNQLHTIEMSESLLKKIQAVKDWKIDQNYGRRWYYAKETRIGIPQADRVHNRKLDVVGTGEHAMSKIYQYYSFGV